MFSFFKKGIEMSMNLIIVIVIGLLIIAIVVFLLGDRVGLFKTGVSCASTHAGRCIPADACDSEEKYAVDAEGNQLCTVSGHVCCPLVG